MAKKILLLFILAVLINAILFSFTYVRHMFVTGLNPYLGAILLSLSALIALPVVIFLIRKTTRYLNGRIHFDPATIFILGFFIFLTGDFINEWLYGYSTLDFHWKDTYYVITHAHARIFFALIFLIFSAAYFIYPGVVGRTMNAPMGYIHAAFTLFAACLICWPSHYMGLAGMPRRYIDYDNWKSLDKIPGFYTSETRVLVLLIFAQLIFVINLIYSAMRGKRWRPV